MKHLLTYDKKIDEKYFDDIKYFEKRKNGEKEKAEDNQKELYLRKKKTSKIMKLMNLIQKMMIRINNKIINFIGKKVFVYFSLYYLFE